ncbi:hypothetical protein [Variovorax sp. OV329]|uniref:hypothetical protein n=1 Tax=Variovorax sp. OV329 TaxID=1882825 RepID=UPI0008E3C9FA|nr:hypothetical protein [Variovorax sp. OV329]SFM89320.1 hypothetical protein SAMN05444747_110185 [Variovorax sp. OV329]
MPRLSPLCIAWGCAALAMSHTIAFAAPQVWRCAGNSYSDRPCEGGREFDANASPPTVDQRRQADEGTRKDQAAATRMQRERQQLEAQQGQNGAVVIGPAPRDTAKPASPATVLKPSKKKKAEKPDTFAASGPDPKQATRKKKPGKSPEGAG